MKDEDLNLDGLDLDRTVPAPADMKQRWHDSIDRAAQRECLAQRKSPSPFHAMSFFWGTAVTAALAIGVAIGVVVSNRPAETGAGETVTQASATGNAYRPDAFNRVLQVHLRDTERNIAALPGGSADDRALLILKIIQQNRMFERAAERNDSANLARVLRAFEPILLRLAAEDIAPEDADALREQLVFELKVMLTKLERNPSKDTQST